jgi:enterochelin esterase-like enzyme
MNNKIVTLDLESTKLLQKPPDKSKIILSNIMYDRIYLIKKLQLSIYTTNNHEILGSYSILVIFIETNKGTVIMKYDEGYRGKDAFDNAVEMLTQYNGLSSVINRALIELENI